MAYRDNVQKLCDSHDIQNPIQERDLTISKLVFLNHGKGEELLVCEVEATDMNRAGRLFAQMHARGASIISLAKIRDEAERFFTSTLWEDCSPERRTLVYGMKVADEVRIVYKGK